MSTEPDPEPLTPDAIVRRASMMGLCSQTHHEHLMRDAATVRKATLAATPSSGRSVTPDLRDARDELVGKVTFLLDGPDTASLTLRNILTRYIDESFAALASVTPSEPTEPTAMAVSMARTMTDPTGDYTEPDPTCRRRGETWCQTHAARWPRGLQCEGVARW